MIYRLQHPFWSSRPGPHLYHFIAKSIGCINDYVIRNRIADIPTQSRWDIPRPCQVDRLSDYVTLLNKNYAIGPDYIHTYTDSILEQLLFAQDVMAYEVIDANICVGLIASIPLKSTKTGQLANVLTKSVSRTTIGLIDFLCVNEVARNAGLANHLISWLDVYTSQINRNIHVFEREGQPAPIMVINKSQYWYCVIEYKEKDLTEVNPVNPLQTIDYIINHGNWDLVNMNDVARWKTGLGVYDYEELGIMIVENAHMMDKNGNDFGIIVVFMPKIGKEEELFNKIKKWNYILATDEIVKLLKSINWKESSTSFTHLYNCVTNISSLKILTI